MRGKPVAPRDQAHRGRNIPAYAGKTSFRVVEYLTPEEHPRVCGENTVNRCAQQSAPGTSPRMRGKQTLTLDEEKTLRNIPAYAGKTL